MGFATGASSPAGGDGSINDKDDTSRQRNLTDLFVTAVEGGINYWSRVGGYVWDAPYAKRGVTVYEFGDSDVPTAEYRLTPALMGKGLSLWAKNRPTALTQCGASVLGMAKTIGRADFDADYDAIDADIIAQYALLGEVVYG